MIKGKYNNFFYEHDDKYHKKGEERQNVNIRISFDNLTSSKEDILKYGLDTSLKYNSHIINETIIEGERYEVELQKLNHNMWYVISILWIKDYDMNTGTPNEYVQVSLDELKNLAPRQLNIFGEYDYE